jgi:hypothetical protein
MHSHQHDVFAPFLLEEVEDLLPVVADDVIADNFDCRAREKVSGLNGTAACAV